MMRFILRGRRRVTLVAQRIVNDVHMSRGSIMRFILRGRCSTW